MPMDLDDSLIFYQMNRNWALTKLKVFVNPLPNKKKWALTKLKAFADDKFNITKMLISLFDKVENIVEKGENAG